MQMRRRMSIHCSTIHTAAVSGALTQAPGLDLVVMSLEQFMVPTFSNSIIISIRMEVIMVVFTITLVVIMECSAQQVPEPACWIPLPVGAKPFTAIRTLPDRRSSKMSHHFRLTHRRPQAIVVQLCPLRSVPKHLAIQEHHLAHLPHHSSSNTINSSRICSLEDLPSSVVHRIVIPVPHFNINKLLQPTSISNLNKDLSLHQTNRTLSNLPNRSRLLPAGSLCSALF